MLTKHPVQLKTVTTCFQNMFFSKKAPKQKGGCLHTLDTPWIRHWIKFEDHSKKQIDQQLKDQPTAAKSRRKFKSVNNYEPASTGLN